MIVNFFASSKPFPTENFVEAVRNREIPERFEFLRLSEADEKHNGSQKSSSVGKTYSSNKGVVLNRFVSEFQF